MIADELFIRRSFDLARLGAGRVAPNPMVGAVIVYKGQIIGEGFHQQYGGAHAEVNAVSSVIPEHKSLLSQSTLYISLEPCCIHGNTPPCTDLILKNRIPRVVFSNLDQTPGVDGHSIELLRQGGTEVLTGVLKDTGAELSAIRNIFVSQQRPYIILKYAQSKDGYIGQKGKPVWLTNSFSKRLVHKWRSEVDAIMVGTNTAKWDNPQLTTRFFSRNSPLRIVFDKYLQLPHNLNLLDDSVPTWLITQLTYSGENKVNTVFPQIPFDQDLIPKLMRRLYEHKKSCLLVEGGAQLLQHFLDLGYWDEARVFVANRFLQNGIAAPSIPKAPLRKIKIDDDELHIFKNHHI